MRAWLGFGLVVLVVGCETGKAPDTVYCQRKERSGWLSYGCYDTAARCSAGQETPCVTVTPVAWTCYVVKGGGAREACLPSAAICSEVSAVTMHDRSIAGRQTECAPAPEPTCFRSEDQLWCRSTPASCQAAYDDIASLSTRVPMTACKAWPVAGKR